jgi:phospholipid/cholesterol/gamma-HCH transport system substrate-binding protein
VSTTAQTRMPGGRLRRLGTVLVAAGTAAVLVGCQGAYDLPLPGGAAARGDVYRITAEFADVLDLVPQSSVKVDQVTVGAVEEIDLNGWTARVTLRLPTSVKLPDNATAEIKQTSLLGEKYIELAPPAGAEATGELGEGDNIVLDRTSRNPEVEEVLSAMSLLLNGGGVAQLKVIETELNNALRGNDKEIKDLIGQLDTFVGGLEAQKSEIVRAIDGIDRLSARLAAQKKDIAEAIEAIPGGLKILADQRKQFVDMLEALNRLGAVGTDVIQQSKADTQANLEALAPILTQLNKAGDDLPASMELLLTYPFSDGTLAAMKGDYTNLHVTADLDMRNLAGNLGVPTAPPTGGEPGLPDLPVPTLPVDPSLPDVPDIPLPGQSPSSSSTSPGGGSVCVPGVTCLGSGQSGSSSDGSASDGSWRSLYSGGEA